MQTTTQHLKQTLVQRTVLSTAERACEGSNSRRRRMYGCQMQRTTMLKQQFKVKTSTGTLYVSTHHVMTYQHAEGCVYAEHTELR